MSCVEKRHMSHRVGSMLHHRFPNGFTDLFMDETDREVSTLTDRAFRSLCVGDDAVYNDEFLYGYSPFSCHKPLVGEPLKKTHHKESKKQGQNKHDKNYAQPWKQQQQKSISHMSSFLKALSAAEESCEGMLIKNGGLMDAKGESWDKSALRSIQRELSEFSSDYHANLTDGHYKKHHSGNSSSNKSGKNAALPSGKSSMVKNGKSTVKLKKLNIKNFFLHSEFSPFQSWRDLNQFPFGQQDTVLPSDHIPKWYDLPFYKELTEAHRKETLHEEETQPCQNVAIEAPPPAAPKPIPPSPPPKVLPKPSAPLAEKRCSSDVGEGSAAPWRRNRSRAKSVIPVNQPGMPPQGKTVDESVTVVKKEAKAFEVKAIEEASSVASTPFSICQLMTPLIPSRQPTETSEILQGVFSPSALDLPLRPHSEAKVMPEPPVKRDNYKSLASSILFNLKDNRKRVKSRYSPPKFKTSEVPGGGTQSPHSDYMKHAQTGSEGYASGLSTPAVLKDGQTVCSPVLESIDLTKHNTDRPLSDDYLLTNLLQSKKETGDSNPISPLIHSKKNKSPMAKKQNYPSLNLYKKTSPVDSDMKYLQVPQSSDAALPRDQPEEANELSPLTLNKELSPRALPANTGISPSTLNIIKDRSPIISPHVLDKEELSTNLSVQKRSPNLLDKAAKQPAKDIQEKYFGVEPVTAKEKDTSGLPMSTLDVIRAAREAINAAKNKALSETHPDNINKPTSEREEHRENNTDKKDLYSKDLFSGKKENSVTENNKSSSQNGNEAPTAMQTGKKGNIKKEPPPVPKRNFAKSDIQLSLEKQPIHNVDKLSNGDLINQDLPPSDNEPVQKQNKHKHLFSTRQNNYIKYQRHSATDEEHLEQSDEGNQKVNMGLETDEERTGLREMKDSEHIIHDLHALKELERARLGDRVLDNAKNKSGVVNIDEETRAKNDLISRELRNIKKGMLSMRGNTSAKRELFTNKMKEQHKQETFSKVDGNVIVNKALLNDNYDKAKMALEEIISERQKKRNKFTEHDANPAFDENGTNESYVEKVEQRKKAMKDSMTEVKQKQNGGMKENDLKERLGDLRDHTQMRQIMSQTEPGLSEAHSLGGKRAGKELIMSLKSRAKYLDERITDNQCYQSEEADMRSLMRHISEDSGENMMSQNENMKEDAPPVPPRNKKGGGRTDGSVTEDTDSLKDEARENIFNKADKHENNEVRLREMRRTALEKQEANSDKSTNESLLTQSDIRIDKERLNIVNKANSKCITEGSQSENKLCFSPKTEGNETKSYNTEADLSTTTEVILENCANRAQGTGKVKRRAPLRPDHINTSDGNVTNTLEAEGPGKANRAVEEINVDAEAGSETPRSIISPLLLVNGVSICQSPPDQASSSSKSSYFSVESALQRNTETESNVYHSLENLIGEVDEADDTSQAMSPDAKLDLDRAEAEFFSLSDHESEPEIAPQLIKSPQEKTEAQCKDSKDGENTSVHSDENSQTMSPTNAFSPPLGIPALFKVKDNTLINRSKKNVQPWSPRGSISGSERGEEELHEVKETPGLPPITEPAITTTSSDTTQIQDELLAPKKISPNTSVPLLQCPSNLQSENSKKPQFSGLLTVPQEEDRYSGMSPSSEGVESLPNSTAEELGMNTGLPVECEVSKVPSERSGSTCSGNESQSGLPKPPAVLPKSQKAVLKAIKLTNRRIKKEEAQKSPHKSSSSSSKQRTERHKSDKPEHKSSSSSNSRSNKTNEKKHRDRSEDSHGHSESHGKHQDNQSEQLLFERGHSSGNHHERTDNRRTTQRRSYDSVESTNQSNDAPTERKGRSSNRHVRDKPEQRPFSSDRVISNVPVYKAHVNENPATDRPFNRSQSIDRYLGDKVEQRLSADMSVNENLDTRSQRIEKSIMDELQQRGRTRDKAGRENPVRRSHSIDAFSTEVPHPSNLSRQSSHTSQLSRQSSIEHPTIVTQSFPMTQRKLLQDPDSGQYFFVDMPVQVKTKTFFDPETGSYVQLPVQPPEGAVPQASPMEVLTPPMVVYHGFVPVPLSPMAQKATIQTSHIAPEEFEQRHLERAGQMHCKERHPYLEPVYAQHDHVLGEFLGTEEVDCPS